MEITQGVALLAPFGTVPPGYYVTCGAFYGPPDGPRCTLPAGHGRDDDPTPTHEDWIGDAPSVWAWRGQAIVRMHFSD